MRIILIALLCAVSCGIGVFVAKIGNQDQTLRLRLEEARDELATLKEKAIATQTQNAGALNDQMTKAVAEETARLTALYEPKLAASIKAEEGAKARAQQIELALIQNNRDLATARSSVDNLNSQVAILQNEHEANARYCNSLISKLKVAYDTVQNAQAQASMDKQAAEQAQKAAASAIAMENLRIAQQQAAAQQANQQSLTRQEQMEMLRTANSIQRSVEAGQISHELHRMNMR